MKLSVETISMLCGRNAPGKRYLDLITALYNAERDRLPGASETPAATFLRVFKAVMGP